MKTYLVVLLLSLSASCGCETEVQRSARKVKLIMEEAQHKPESMDALDKLEPYLNHDSYFVRSWACQVLGEIYAGTQDVHIASRCASILCGKLDEYREGEKGNYFVTQAAARSLLKVGLPSGHPDTETIERKLRNAAKDLIEWDASWYAIEALAVIENPSDETFDTLVDCFRSVHEDSRHHAASALARFGSRARVVLPDLKEALAETPPGWAHREISAAITTIEESVAKEDADSRK
jgi:hypothetical protein